jgi:hypothetical protein
MRGSRYQLVYLIGKQRIDTAMQEAEKMFKAFLNKCYWTSHLSSAPLIEFQKYGATASSRVTASEY